MREQADTPGRCGSRIPDEAMMDDHNWSVGDVVIWDNRCTMHRRNAFDKDARRIMHRTQIKGTRPYRDATRNPKPPHPRAIAFHDLDRLTAPAT